MSVLAMIPTSRQYADLTCPGEMVPLAESGLLGIMIGRGLAATKTMKKAELIAPCGMNCGICSGYLAGTRDVKARGIKIPYCTGCRPRGKKCAFLKKRCDLLLNGKVQYCHECRSFPCERLQGLDTRYQTLFRMSMIENLESIKENGIAQFLRQQSERWKCQKCGGVICCHNGVCFDCGLNELTSGRKLYRWKDE
jgi:hypothetical protein